MSASIEISAAGYIAGIICLWVDDMVILRTQQNFCENFKNKVSEKFKISSYDDLSLFLNIETEKNTKMLNQGLYRKVY